MSQGQDLWRKAQTVIAGGNMLLSKRPDMFLPDHWPAYFSRAKGCFVWDLEGHKFTDMAIMGIGTNTLGFGDDRVDDAVRATIDAGNMSTLNAPEEVALAERLVAMHPWADMARFARTGGEANAIAIRIARAASGRDGVAICGYHGWHDWYLATNLSDADGLDEHLLPGLSPAGVPSDLAGSVHGFEYNDLDALAALIDKHDIGVIKMEVSRQSDPAAGFLEGVRALADQHEIVLIFDECTSGFRQAFGGLHLNYNVDPDMAVFGKALGNGYAVTAVLGTKETMSAVQDTFISSTFWTERIGSAAAIATLDAMEQDQSWVTITETGRNIMKRWHALAQKYELSLTTGGLPALCNFSIANVDAAVCKTFITQEMLKQDYLATTSVYVSTAHTAEILDGYFAALDPVFEKIATTENLSDLLDGPVCQTGFSRLA